MEKRRYARTVQIGTYFGKPYMGRPTHSHDMENMN
jgi:hypothetical protein